MRENLRSKLSFANVTSALALFVALGGTSYAALARNSVGTVQLKRGAVTGIKVRGNTLTGTQINEARLAKVPSARRADTAGSADSAATATNATTATTAGSAPVSRLDYASAAVSVPAGGATATRGTVSCAAGLSATGGGAKMADPTNGFIVDTNPVGKTGWEATAFSGTTQNMTVYVICAQAATTTP